MMGWKTTSELEMTIITIALHVFSNLSICLAALASKYSKTITICIDI
jgi:hypothetical protein